MSVIRPLEPDAAPGKSKNLLDAVKASLGMVPNLFRVMAHSPATLEGFLSFNSALGAGTLDAKSCASGLHWRSRKRIAAATASPPTACSARAPGWTTAKSAQPAMGVRPTHAALRPCALR